MIYISRRSELGEKMRQCYFSYLMQQFYFMALLYNGVLRKLLMEK